MQQRTLIGVGSIAALSLIVISTQQAVAGGQVGALVRLQAANPGVAQLGHSNISGTARAGALVANAFQLPTGAANGRYLTSDASGNASWSNFAFVLPYEQTGVTNGNIGLFRIINNGTQAAIEGRNQSNAFGRLGGSSYGAYGEHGSSFNRGSLGNSDTGASGSNNNNPSYGYLGGTSNGAWGEHGGVNGTGVRGRAYNTGGTNYGVHGTSASPDGVGVFGYNSSTLTFATGVRGESISTNSGIGVHALSGFYGVYADANRPGNLCYGVYALGTGTGARGVFGFADGDGTKYGVRGSASGTGTNYGVYSVTDLGVAGNKQFVIDHPDDPANMYLKHYCTEGPAPMNAYSGIVTTDASGFAWVELPHYFDKINKDPRYTLTVIDESDDFVLAKVSKPIQDLRFQVRTSKPGVKVSWEVKAQRNDLWNQKNPPQVEVLKDDKERGKYQRPELYGLPDSMGMDYNERREVRRNK